MNAARNENVADLVVESLLPGRANGLSQLFNAEGLPAPEIIWSPQSSELLSPLHRQFATKCQSIADPEGRVPDARFGEVDFGGLIDWLMVVEIEGEGEDFVYSQYGNAIAEASGMDMRGRRTSEFGGHVSIYFNGLYRAILKVGDWVYARHESPLYIFVAGWRRLIVPLYGEDGSITRLAALNIPENDLSVGLELMIDPVFVVDHDHMVLCSNKAARGMFGFPPILSRAQTLEKLTGIGLNVPASPEELLAQNRVLDSIELAPNGSIMERLVMTVSAAEHRGQAIYVVVMRMIGT